MTQSTVPGKRMARAAATAAILLPLAALTGCTAPAPRPVPVQHSRPAASPHPVVAAPRIVIAPARDAKEVARLTYNSGSSTVTNSVTLVSPGVTSYAVTFGCNAQAGEATFGYTIDLNGADLESASITCDPQLHKDVAEVYLPKGSTIRLSMQADFAQITSAFVVLSRE